MSGGGGQANTFWQRLLQSQIGRLVTDIDIEVSNTGAATAISAPLGAAAGLTTYITGFSVTGAGATAASIIAVTISGLANTLTFFLVIPAGVTTSITPLIISFPRPLPASAVNTSIVVNVPSFGLGNTNAAVTAYGFQR